jgi:hypothetical protein
MTSKHSEAWETQSGKENVLVGVNEFIVATPSPWHEVVKRTSCSPMHHRRAILHRSAQAAQDFIAQCHCNYEV